MAVPMTEVSEIFARLPIATTRRVGAEARVDLRQRRKWFDETGSNAGGGSGGEGGGTQGGAGNSAGNNGGAGAGNNNADDRNPAWLAPRLQRASEAAQRSMLDTLGYPTLEALQAALSGANRQAGQSATQGGNNAAAGQNGGNSGTSGAAQQTPAQPDPAIEQAEQARQQAERERDELRTQLATRDRNAVIHTAAQKAFVIDTGDLIAWAEKNQPALLEALKDDALKPESDAMKALIDACRTARPHFFRGGVGSPSNSQRSTALGQSPETTEQQTSSWYL